MPTYIFSRTSLAALTVMGLTAHAASAQETRQLGAHVHGESVLSVAVDGSRLVMELDAPGMDVVGFEHAAVSDADQAAVSTARETLSDPIAVFGVPAAAGCSIVSQEIDYRTEEADAHEDHAEAAHDADHETAEEHAHDDAAEHAHDDAAEHAESDHDHDEASGHAAFEARYELTCENPDALDGLNLTFFELFPNAQTVDVTFASAGGQTAGELTPDDARIDF